MVCVSVFMVVSIAFTIYAISKPLNHDFNTLTYLFDFAIGILAAVIMHKDNRVVSFFKKMSRINSVLFLLALPVLFFVLFLFTDLAPAAYAPWLDLLGRYIFIIYVGLFIIDQVVNERAILKLKSNSFLVYTGKISYGLYCFHGIVLTFGIAALQKMDLSMPLLLQVIIFLVINYLVASLSYRFIERPFLRLKDKLRRI